jgi:hypothetical protein
VAARLDRLVPLISPGVPGPLGVAHLPRMWLKGILHGADMLSSEYFPHYIGINERVLDALGVDHTAFFAYLATLPTYPQTERWVREHATKLNPIAIATINMDIMSYMRPAEWAAEKRARVGLDDPRFTLITPLLNLDDWCTAHANLVAHRHDGLEPIIPAISSGTPGPSGVLHLPRLWMKALLAGIGALPEGWNSACGFDQLVADVVGFDCAAACAYVRTELPTYMQFEAWLRANAAQQPDEETVYDWNKQLRGYQKSEEKAAKEREEAGAPELTHREAIILNDMVDWKYLHEQVLARRAALA